MTPTSSAIADPARWASLAGQCAVADGLFGQRGFERVRRWLAAEFHRIDAIDFARSFSAHVQLPGIVERDFNHRLVRSSRGDVLGGIRFYSRDIGRPFVEIICHTFTELDHLTDCVSTEWAAFGPLWARLHGPAGEQRPPRAILDLTVYAARCAEMTAPDGRVELTRFRDPADAIALVAQRYSELAAEDPELARRVTAADPADLRSWHDAGQLHAVTVAHAEVGALAIAPGAVLWIDGYEVDEEVILASYAGNGYAASAQSAWAHRAEVDPDMLLVGTIDGRNTVSRRTTVRAGRRPILDATFVNLRTMYSWGQQP